MSYPHNATWTPSEKVDLLVNVLQGAVPDLPAFLLQIIHDHGVYPKWNDIPLPKGRSLHSSQIVFEEMSRLSRQQGRPPAQSVAVAYPPAMNIAPAIPQKRAFAEPELYTPQQRALQPRPPRSTDSPAPAVTNGEVVNILPRLMTEPVPEVRKKRGRPSKEEAEERDRQLAAEGKVYQPKKRSSKKLRASAGTPGPDARVSDVAPPPTVHTPKVQTPEAKDETSSGKKRARRTPRDEESPTEGRLFGPATQDSQNEAYQPVAQSPSDRLLASHRERELPVPKWRDINQPASAEEKPDPSRQT